MGKLEEFKLALPFSHRIFILAFFPGTVSGKMGHFLKPAPMFRTIFYAFFQMRNYPFQWGTLFLRSIETAVNKRDRLTKCFRSTLDCPNLSHFWCLKMHVILSFTRSLEEKYLQINQSLRFCGMYATHRI